MGAKLQLPSVPVILLLGHQQFIDSLPEGEAKIYRYLLTRPKATSGKPLTVVKQAFDNGHEVRNYNRVLDSIWHRARIYGTDAAHDYVSLVFRQNGIKTPRLKNKRIKWQTQKTKTGKKLFVTREQMKELTRQYEIQVMDS